MRTSQVHSGALVDTFNHFSNIYFSGIYLCTVMTLTSLSVIMAVMVINLYNRGTKTRRAPFWVRSLVLKYMSALLRMRHDLDKVVESLTLVSHLSESAVG